MAAYRYTTVVGAYEFPKSAPYLLRYETSQGNVLAFASTFLIDDPTVVSFANARVLEARSYRFQVRYDFIIDGIVQGNVTLKYDFHDDRAPKSTVELKASGDVDLPLAWVTLTSDHVAATEAEIVDFGDFEGLREIEASDFALDVGPTTSPHGWTRRLSLDWSDAEDGIAFIGSVSLAGLQGSAVVVRFPTGTALVDPVLVGSSTVASPTKYTIQRKAFAHGDRFWTFWNDGTGIVYASSRDGKTWSAKGIVTTSLPATGFDVDERGGTVLLTFIPSTDTKRIAACIGKIDGAIIQWGGGCPDVYSGWQYTGTGPPSAAIGTDGQIWVAVTHEHQYLSGTNWLYVFRLCSDSFCLDYDQGFPGTPAQSAVRLLAMPNGTLAVLASWQGSGGEIRFYRYDQSGWPPPSEPYPYDYCFVNWDSGALPQDAISAVALADGRARIVYRGATNGRLDAVVYDPADPFFCSAPVTLDARAVESPTISLDRNGDAHVFYFYRESSPARYHIFYNRTIPLTGLWSPRVEEPIPPVDNIALTSLTAAPFAPAYVAIVWSDANKKTWFSAVPTPLDLGSQIGSAWSRQGISPYQAYFEQLGEFVSPTTGSLTVKQTDFALPGRKLDLEIARVFVTPRAFASGATASPYLYENYPYANLGKGWRLNLPWISPQYLHLMNGQMVVLDWDGDNFENHAGEHFLLRRTSCGSGCYNYVLSMKNGIRYAFDSSGRLTSVTDPVGNAISLNYVAAQNYANRRIDYLLDTVGRRVSFAYNGDGTVSSISTGPLVVTYGYQLIGGLTMLQSVTDGLGRRTLFEYGDPRSPYLLTAITYPTGAKTVFSWSNPSAVLSSDLQAYFVTLQDTLNGQGASIRSYRYNYTAVNGKVAYSKATGFEAGVKKGSTTFQADLYANRLTTTTRDASEIQMGKTVTWFGSRGEPERVDVYPGLLSTPSHSTYAAYDDWGNVIYTRDGIGQERFTSFVNTRYQGGFFAPGRLEQTASGLLFYDDFEDRDLTDWTRSGSVQLDETKFETFPPSLNLSSAGSSADHGFPAQSNVFAEAIVNPGLLDGTDVVRLKGGATVLVEVRFTSGGQIQFQRGDSSWALAGSYVAGQWYRLTVDAWSGVGMQSVFVNGDLAGFDCLVGGGSWPSCSQNRPDFDRIRFESSPTFGVDAVKVWKSQVGGSEITVSGLRPGQMVGYGDTLGRTSATSKVPQGANSATLSFAAGVPAFPYGTVIILDEYGEPEFTSPNHEFWGGDTWTYTSPWRSSPARTRDGFLRATTGGIYLDENASKPHATYWADRDYDWDTSWGAHDFPVKGADSHRSAYVTGIHKRGFHDASSTLTMTSGSSPQYHIQYVYIPPGASPSEIMLEFRDTGNSWEHRAYWGADLISYGNPGTDPDSRRSMGGLPSAVGRWLMLIVRTNDVGPDSGTWTVEGLSFALYGGGATWDFSARGDSETGQIRIEGLQQNWKAELYYENGTFIRSGTVPTGGTVAAIDVYSATPRVTVFPIRGYFLVRDAANLAVYRSPSVSFWGGDAYRYSPTDFYPNANVNATIHDRPACTLEYQTGRGAPTPIPTMACLGYRADGLLDRSKVKDGSGWRQTAYAYDETYGGTYGLLTTVTDPKGNWVSFRNSATYGRAYVTQISDVAGSVAQYTYDSPTGRLLSEIDGRGYTTQYEYDVLGRPTVESRRDPSGRLLSSSRVAFDDTGNVVTSFDPTTAPRLVHLDMESLLNGKLEDLAGQGRHATMTGTGPATGRIGGARDFDGVDDYLAIAASPSLNSASFTASLWFRRDATTTYTPRPSANGGTVQWSRTGCSFNFDCVDESSSDGDSTYVYSSTLGQVDLYELANLPGGTGPILSVTVTALVRVPPSPVCKAEYGEPCWANIRLRVNGYDGTVQLVSESTPYRTISQTWTTNPATGQAWTEAEINALQAGFKLDATNWVARVTQLYVEVNVQDGNFVTNQGLIGKPSFPNSWRIWARTDGKIEADAKNDAVGNLVSQTVGAAGTWYHVAVSFDGTTARLYVNGIQEASAATADWGGAYNSAIWIGDTESTSPFDGIIDEVHFFDRALSATEVSSIYQGTERGFYQKAYFDVLGRNTRIVRRDLFQASVSWQALLYDFRDQVVSRSTARSATSTFTTAYAYDFLGRPTRVTYPDFPNNPVTLSYDDGSRIRTVVAENGRKMQYLYDLAGRTTASREYYDASSYYTTGYAYDEVGNLLTVTNALGQVTRHEYDSLNRLTKTIYADTTKSEEYTYDEVGHLKTRRDRAGQVTTYNYETNARYRLQSIDYSGTAANPDVSYAYDGNDNPTAIATLASPATSVAYLYDGLDRVLYENTTVGGTVYPVNYSYDPAGRVARLTYPNNADGSRSWVGYTYDPVGRTSSVYDPTSTFASFAYFADDLMKDVGLGNQVTNSYVYNGRGWPSSIRATNGGSTYLDLAYSSYDASGNVQTIGGTTQPSQSFTYDKLDRLTTASGGFGSQTYTYDSIGNRMLLNSRTAVLRPNAAGASAAWGYSGCTSNWQCVDEETADGLSTYVSSGTPGSADRYGLSDLPVGATGIRSVTVTAVGYVPSPCEDPLGCWGKIRLRVNGYDSAAKALSPNGFSPVSNTWTANPATGQAWTEAEVNALEAGIVLDSTNWFVRVTQVYVTVDYGDPGWTTYAYANGPTGMNTLTSMTTAGGTTSFTYDANGNLDTKTGGWDFDWNPENLMTTAKVNGVPQQTYTYDGLGRRVNATSGSAWTVSIVAGMDVIYEKSKSGSTTTVTRYVHANGMRIARIECLGNPPTCTTSYYLGDHLGSTRKVLRADRTVAFSAEYEPFGKPYNVTGSETYKYTSEKHDDPTSLVYLRARQYDPEIGRFVSADPVLGSLSRPQTLNRYGYAVNNPLRFVDPSGKFLEDIDWASVGAFVAGAAVVAGIIACGVITAGVCIGVVGALILATVAGAATATAITVAQGKPVTLETVMGGGLMGLTGGTFVYTAALAGVFGAPAAEAAFGMTYGVSAASMAGGGILNRLLGRGRPPGAAFENTPERFALEEDWYGYQYGPRQGYTSRWASPTRYMSASQARAELALPPWNDAAFVRPVRLPAGTVVWQGRASGLFGQPGRGMQIWVSNPSKYSPGPWTSATQLYYIWEE